MSQPHPERYARLIRIRWVAAGPALLALAGLLANYIFRGVNTQTQPIVAALDQAPYILPLLFGLPLAALTVALWLRRYIAHAYMAACVAFEAYGVALAWASVTNGASWGTASLSLGMSLACFVLGRAYARET